MHFLQLTSVQKMCNTLVLVCGTWLEVLLSGLWGLWDPGCQSRPDGNSNRVGRRAWASSLGLKVHGLGLRA